VKHAVPKEHRAFAKGQRSEMSRAEWAIWEVLRASRLGGWKFKRQVPYGPYVADFSCAEAKLIVELDGPLHEEAEQQARDAARDRWFEGRGFRVLRVPNEFVLGRIELAVKEIERALPSPCRGVGRLARSASGERRASPTRPSPRSASGRVGPPPERGRVHARFPYRRSPDQDRREAHRPLVVVVAGPVGLCAAIDLAQRGVPVVLLDDADRIGEGSRGICYAKRTLEILDRLGVAERCLEKGVTWKLGKVFQRDALLYEFDLLPEDGHKMPAFINLQQYHLETFLCERAAALDNLDIRWRNKVSGIEPRNDGARLTIDTPDGPYTLQADWVIAADGARSTVRRNLDLAFIGEAFEDRFLIADVKMASDFPPERWFWFDPPFHRGRSALLHKQPDDIWRVDLQLGAEADPIEEQRPERVLPRLRQMLGHESFSLEWVSVYTFQCRRLQRFVHGRVIFAGDAAHQLSPFGARGGNSGLQDAENLAWKLALILKGEAPASLIDSYDRERSAAADENIGHSTRSTDFIAPRSAQELRFRDAALALAREAPFAKRMVNSGRLSSPAIYETPLSTPDRDVWGGSAQLGAPVPDAPLLDRSGKPVWLLEALGGDATLLTVKNGAPQRPVSGLRRLVVGEDLVDTEGHFTRRFDATPGATYLVRPDQHLAARWRAFDGETAQAAFARASGAAGAA
jgi:3-(3-hydroxy-phenyl)propionate hydroxylase